MQRLKTLLLIMIMLATVSGMTAAQQTRNLLDGVPVETVLATDSVSQVFTYAAAGETVSISATNDSGVPLVVTVTDDAGEPLAQAIDNDIDGLLILENLALPAQGTVYITVFKAGGVASIAEVTFTVTLDVVPAVVATAAPTEAPTAAPTAIVEATPAPAVDTAGSAPVSQQVITATGLQVVLSWDTSDDLDLEVRDPIGGSLYWRTPTVTSGGTLSPNVNQGCVATVAQGNETASWSSGGIPTGSYEVLVYFQQSCNNNAPVSFTITPVVDGVTLGPINARLDNGGVYALGFTVDNTGGATLNNNGGIVQTNILPAPIGEIVASAGTINAGDVLNGTIVNAEPYRAYAFQAEGGLLYSAGVEATSGSLDTYISIVDSTGAIVRDNDDIGVGITDSQVGNVLIQNSGTYYVVVSRYGKAFGATEGDFIVSLSATDINLPDDFSANITPGSLQILLVWNTNADLQLLVRDPAGDAVFDDVTSIRSGGSIVAFGNRNCAVSEGAPYSYIYWPVDIAPRPGSYEAEVWFQNECGDTTPVSFTLLVLFNGQPVANFASTPFVNDRFLTSFDILADNTAVSGPGGIIRGADDLPWRDEVAQAVPIAAGAPATGSITPSNKYDLYAFDGSAGDVVNIALNNTSGTLDPTLYLIGPSGTVVGSNDDAVAGENTNSLLANLTLPEDGRYIIIATHYGGLYGGTIGTYQLSYSQLN